ncbi:MAG: TlpA family protein disulfide reductase [Anaerolineales bacterium]
MLGGGVFRLSEQRGAYVLLLPTVFGCGDCLANLTGLGPAYRDYRGRALEVVILDLYPGDEPEIWASYGEGMGEPEFAWGVIESTDFLIDYEMQTLGTILLIDPEGRIVFRSEYAMSSDGFRRLFEAALRPGEGLDAGNAEG